MRLRELEISNYRSIGPEGVTIRIDNIVVLIGSNNVGKSTVLKAYEVFASSINTSSFLSPDDFNDQHPEKPVIISGVFCDISDDDRKKIGDKWVYNHDDYGNSIMYRWFWADPDHKGKKQSWNPGNEEWEDGGMGGWDQKIISCIPTPIMISPFEDPSSMEKKIIEILTSTIKKNLKDDSSTLEPLIEQINTLAEKFSDEIKDSIEQTTDLLESKIQEVFPSHKVNLKSQSGDIDLSKIIAAGSHLEIIDPNGSYQSLDKQGTGLQRTFLWAAINALADTNQLKIGRKNITDSEPRILLIEEPETFLHPPAIRSAREALYNLAELENWQVVLTTHSPIFIDVAKPHTTIIRLDRDKEIGTRTFVTDKAQFDEDERERLKMIRSCHPTVNEFFFSEEIVLVEGDTELALFNNILEINGKRNKYHIINCLGKANIPLFQKILNHFSIEYIIIHDTDAPKSKSKKGYRINSMWSINEKIYNRSEDNIVVAHTPDLERFYFDTLTRSDKPYSALKKIEEKSFIESEKGKMITELFSMIENGDHPCIVKSVEDYEKFANEYVQNSEVDDPDLWKI